MMIKALNSPNFSTKTTGNKISDEKNPHFTKHLGFLVYSVYLAFYLVY